MDNGTYGLTKGKFSRTSQGGFRGFPARADRPDHAGLSIPATTFLARGYSGAGDQLDKLTDAAIRHANAGHGFAFLEVISPCVASNDRDDEWPANLFDVDLDPSHDPTDRAGIFARLMQLEAESRVPTGQIFLDESVSTDVESGPAQQNIDPTPTSTRIRTFSTPFRPRPPVPLWGRGWILEAIGGGVDGD